MKPLLLGCIAATLLLTHPRAATAQSFDTTQIQGFLQHLFQPLNKGQIPTGFLEEYGLPAISMAPFNGTAGTSNWSNPNLWRLLYFQLFTSYVGTATNPLPTIQSVNNTINQNLSPGAPIPIPVLLANYNKIRADALQQNLLRYDGTARRLFDVAGRTQSPYTQHRLFSAVPMRQTSHSGTETFIFRTGMVWGNTGLGVRNLQVNFANGQGFVTLAPNTPVQVNWIDTGYYQLTIRAALTNGTTAECKADYYVLQKKAISAARYTPSTIQPFATIAPVTGVHSGGTVQVVYSSKQPTSPVTLRKPLIVVEDMDAFDVAPMLRLRPNGINDFLDQIDESRPSYDFNQQLDDVAGYDLIFINFNRGMDAVERNAAVVSEALRLVNNAKRPDNRAGNIRQQNVVLGMGTGGLNARYALAQQTRALATTTHPNPTETRLLLTHDAPHRGQNIALGLQHLSRMLANFRYFGASSQDVFPEYAQAMAYLQAPVMEQTLMYRATSEVANSPNTFINNVYQPMVNYTAPYRFVATSLGNECARPVHGNKKFMDFGQSSATGIKVKLSLFGVVPLLGLTTTELKYEVGVYAGSIPPPAFGDRKIAAMKQGFKFTLLSVIPVSKPAYDKTAYAPASYLPVDGAPGSINTILNYTNLREYQEKVGNLEISSELLITKVKLGTSSLYLNFYSFLKLSEWNLTEFTTLYTALPVGSALDVSPFDGGALNQKFVNGANPLYPSRSETYIAQESVAPQNLYNNFSMRFTARNARFLFNEMEGLANLENCSSECSNPYTIAGPDLLCTSEQYSITGLPRGVILTWTISPSTLGTIAPGPTPHSVIIRRSSNGRATISAVAANWCTNNTINSRVVQFGGYSSSDYPVSGPTTAGCNQLVTYSCPQLPGATNYVWIFPGSPWQYVSGQGTTSLALRTPASGSHSGQIGVRVANACDAGGSPAIRFTSVNCTFARAEQAFELAPNPAASTVNITAKMPASFKAAPVRINEVIIYDQQGVVRQKHPVGGAAKLQVNISQLPMGIYIVEIRSTQGSERQQLSVLR